MDDAIRLANAQAEYTRDTLGLELADRVLHHYDAYGNRWDVEPGTPIDDGTLALARRVIEEAENVDSQ
jgi:hypothetical protein